MQFFILLMLVTLWYVFGVAGMAVPLFRASFRSSCKAGLVVMKYLSNCLFIKDFISPLLMKLSLAGCEILG